MPVNPLFLTDRHLSDLNPIIAGEEVCTPGHGTKPHIRQYTLLHFVYRGKGSLITRGQSHPVEAGQVFLIRPGELSAYAADSQDPWHYGWIGFDGILAARFAELPPVFSLDKKAMERIQEALRDPNVSEYRLAGELLRLYEALFSGSTGTGNRHVRQVKNYIRLSYMHPIRIEKIARQMNLDRRYLSRLFKSQTGLSIQAYLLQVRMAEADKYLLQGYSVREAATMAGYEDISNFSKLYTRHFGISPAQRRKTSQQAASRHLAKLEFKEYG